MGDSSCGSLVVQAFKGVQRSATRHLEMVLRSDDYRIQAKARQKLQNLAGLEPDSATYDSGISSCRAVLRGLQAESSTLPNLLGEARDLRLGPFWA